MLHIMVLKGRFLYVIRTFINIQMVTLKLNQLSDWLVQNINKSRIGYWFAMC